MPTYSYHCPDCGAFDAIQPMAKSGLAVPCPTCTRESERTLTVPAQLGSSLRRQERRTQGGSQDPARYRRWKHVSGCRCC
jgi:putative FmdB family regulatory protein